MITTLTCPIPANINPLSPNGFQFSISKLPDLTYFAQQVNIPGISLPAIDTTNPLSVFPVPGEIVTYDPINVQFMVDESMANYQGIFNWLIGLGFPEKNSQYTTFVGETTPTGELQKNYSDGTLQVLGANNKAIKTIQFIDLVPISLESLIFQSTNQDVQYLIGSATFRYNFYKFV
jgi:hypothetical protein